jgi:hypothetical protein
MPTTLATYNAAKLEPASFPQDARMDAASLAPSLDLAAGTVLGKITATGKLAAYSTSLTNGLGVAVAILAYDTSTDADGKHYLGDSDVPSETNLPHNDCQVYVAGTFRTTDLTGYDADALADFNGRVLPSGFIRIP